MVVHTTAAVIVKAAAPANTGRHLETSQSNRGNRNITGAMSDREPVRMANVNPYTTVKAPTANVPSRTSRNGGGSRTAAATPISRGATDMMPSASDANQTTQMSRNDAVEGPTRFMAPAAPAAAIAVAPAAAANKLSTRIRLSKLKAGPYLRLISQATDSASPALHKPNASALQTFLSLMSAAATVAPITANATGARAHGPSTISVPAAIPEAGQNTAARSAAMRKASPSWAAKK